MKFFCHCMLSFIGFHFHFEKLYTRLYVLVHSELQKTPLFGHKNRIFQLTRSISVYRPNSSLLRLCQLVSIVVGYTQRQYTLLNSTHISLLSTSFHVNGNTFVVLFYFSFVLHFNFLL